MVFALCRWRCGSESSALDPTWFADHLISDNDPPQVSRNRWMILMRLSSCSRGSCR